MPTTPRGVNMRLEPSMNMTPEGSLADIPAVVERERRDSSARGRTIRDLLRNNISGNC